MLGRSLIAKKTATQSQEMPQQLGTFRALRHRNFRLFWTGQLVSLIGTWMQSLALQWLVYQLTGSPKAMGLVAALTSLPVLILSPFTGVLVDRYPKRWLIFGAQIIAMVSTLIMATLIFTGVVQYWHILILALINGSFNAIDMPARQSFTSEMIGDKKEDLSNAIALNASMFNAARFIGPAIAGVLVGLVGIAWAFLINGVSFIGVLIGLWLMDANEIKQAEPSKGSPVRNFVEGARYAVSHPVIRTILTLVFIPSVLGFGYVSLLPIFADQILTTPLIPKGATRLGMIMTANGLGALMGALRMARAHPDEDRRVTLLRGGFGFGIGICLMALNRSFWLALPIMTLIGFSMVSFMATSNTLLQTTSIDRLRGRVMSFYVMVLIGFGLVGSLQAGYVAEHWGVPVATAIGGVACMLSALWGWRSKSLKLWRVE